MKNKVDSPLDCKEIQPVHSERDQPWDFFGGNDVEAETPALWPPHAKSWLIGKDSDAGRDCGQEEKETTEDEMAGWHHWLDGRESEWTPGVGDGQGGLTCCDSWGRKQLDTTEPLNWSELNWMQKKIYKSQVIAQRVLANSMYPCKSTNNQFINQNNMDTSIPPMLSPSHSRLPIIKRDCPDDLQCHQFCLYLNLIKME